MATAMMSRDDSASPLSGSKDIDPHAAPKVQDKEDIIKPNGYVPSPLRASRRTSSVVTDRELPDVPQEEPRSGQSAPETHNAELESGSFPFTAEPGTAGVMPTTGELVNGNAKNEDSSDLLARKSSQASGTATPQARRSVQFARGTAGDDPTPLVRTSTWEADEDSAQTPVKERQGSLFERIRALASSGSSSHTRNASSIMDFATPNATMSPQSETSDSPYPTEESEDVHADAGSETEHDEAGDGISDIRPKKRRKSRRPNIHNAESAPSTPKLSRLESRFASFMRDQSGSHQDGSRPANTGTHRAMGLMTRSNTVSDPTGDNANAGLSEDEGRDRIRNAWRRGLEGARGLSYATRRNITDNEGSQSPGETRRPGHLRRITGLGGSVLDGTSNSPFRAKADRQSSSNAQRWRQVKAGLRMLGQRRRDERLRVDHQKSAQLMAELLAGAPAALVFASMFQRDEHDHRKIPVLLEQLKIRIADSQIRKDKGGDRHLIFKIELEYGNGPARMKWTISRNLKDFVNLHAKYQTQAAADKILHLGSVSGDRKRAKMPRFPRSAFPFARNIRGLFDNLADEESEEEEEMASPTTPGAIFTPGVLGLDDVAESPTTPGAFGPMTPGIGPGPMTPGVGSGMVATPGFGTNAAAKHKRRKSSVFATPPTLRRSSTADLGPLPNNPEELDARQRELYLRRQRRKLETYLQQMIRWLIFRPDSTRLCKFLEISALAIRLSAESGYQGKQGLLTTISGNKKQQRNKALTVASNLYQFAERHRTRWFMVRHSYILIVDGPESLNIYDVFLVDSEFSTEKRKKRVSEQTTAQEVAKTAMENSASAVVPTNTKHYILRLYNSERKLKLYARNERLWLQFQESIDLMVQSTLWSKKQRFASYAPVRNNVWCRWLVDGRDIMWQVSRAIDNAKDFVYIHDWWLSPELYMRRPAAISQRWRLDRLLQRKAQEGVKIFVIVYRNIESAIPIDSEYTKWALLDLHENICIQRSPNQFRQNQFFWAHHEKLVVVDNMMAFVGGMDLCFGRWDDPCHTLTDDKLTGFELSHDGPRDSEHCQMWPGKDYSNPRVQDFYALNRPYEEMYDRTKVPRMPWHDIAMQIVGQPARDTARHFVQRWNYILRSRIPSRPTALLIPPPEYEQIELDSLGMTGSCQVQLLRSCAAWSIGTPNKVEHSIMNAYVHLIKHSQHFVYIENQFFVTSCTVEGTTMHNKIGDALVERIIRAHENDEHWAAIIVIPLMPGFQNSVDSQDGTSIRLIMQCQFRSICRGETSIFGRLRARNIDPEDYIRFYSLRQWGKIGPKKCLTTEMLYIHAKCMIVDDRTVIIGSANINERSMLGTRDSEVAAVVTDMRMVPSFMGDEPYEVGEFAHTLRKRLMREHLGIDVDAIYRREQAAREREEQDAEMSRIYREDAPQDAGDYFSSGPMSPASAPPLTRKNLEVNSTSNATSGLDGTTRVGSSVSLDLPNNEHGDRHKKASIDAQHDLDVDGYGFDNMHALVEAGDVGLTDSFVNAEGREVLLKKDAPDVERIKSIEQSEARRSSSRDRKPEKPIKNPPYPTERMDTYTLGLMPRSQLPELPALDDTDIGGPALTRGQSQVSATKFVNVHANLLVHNLRRPEVQEDCMTDPLSSTFFHDIWHQVAENNTKLYRQVFRCMPDSEVTDWKTYEKFNEYNERFMQSQGLGSSKPRPSKEAPDKSGPPGSANSGSRASVGSIAEKVVGDTRPRSKSVLGGFVDKLRPGSRMSEDTHTHTEEIREKNEVKAQDQPNGSPESPGSGALSGPTAVPSPKPSPSDEKEAQRLNDEVETQTSKQTPDLLVIEKQTHINSDPQQLDEKEGIKEEDMAFTRRRTVQYSDKINHAPETTATQSTSVSTGPQPVGSQKRRRRGTTKSSARQLPEEVLARDDAEALLKLTQGRLVLWPYDWLEKEERGGNWLYNIDQLAPLEIYD